MKARGKARNVVSGFGQLFEAVVDIDKNLSDVLEAVAGVFLAEAVDLFFGGLEHLLRGADAFLDHVGDLIGCRAQVPHERLVVDNCAVLLDVGGSGRNLQELGNVMIRVRLVIYAALFHLVEHGDGVNVLREVEHRIDRLEDLAVLLQVKFIRLQKRNDIRHAPLVNEHGAEHRLLRLERLRHLTA